MAIRIIKRAKGESRVLVLPAKSRCIKCGYESRHSLEDRKILHMPKFCPRFGCTRGIMVNVKGKS